MQVFISYSSKDGTAIASKLHEVLHKNGHDAFHIDFDTVTGDQIWDTIAKECLSRERTIFVLTPSSLESKGQKQEYDLVVASYVNRLVFIKKDVSINAAFEKFPFLNSCKVRYFQEDTLEQDCSALATELVQVQDREVKRETRFTGDIIPKLSTKELDAAEISKQIQNINLAFQADTIIPEICKTQVITSADVRTNNLGFVIRLPIDWFKPKRETICNDPFFFDLGRDVAYGERVYLDSVLAANTEAGSIEGGLSKPNILKAIQQLNASGFEPELIFPTIDDYLKMHRLKDASVEYRGSRRTAYPGRYAPPDRPGQRGEHIRDEKQARRDGESLKDGNGAGEKGYRTSDLARAAGAHPNTVRFYEELGFLPPAERGPNGYRLWTRAHLDQMVFARRALHGLWPGRRIRKSALDLVRIAAAKGPRTALSAARDHARLVREDARAGEQAAAFLERWASGDEEPDPAGKRPPGKPSGPPGSGAGGGGHRGADTELGAQPPGGNPSRQIHRPQVLRAPGNRAAPRHTDTPPGRVQRHGRAAHGHRPGPGRGDGPSRRPGHARRGRGCPYGLRSMAFLPGGAGSARGGADRPAGRADRKRENPTVAHHPLENPYLRPHEQLHTGARSAHAQPEKPVGRRSQGRSCRVHRSQRGGQEFAALRHHPHGSPEAAGGNLLHLRPPEAAQAFPAARGRNPQPGRVHRRGPEAHGPDPPEHGGDGDGGIRLPAHALFPLRPALRRTFLLFFLQQPRGMCPECSGLGKRIRIDPGCFYDPRRNLREGALLHPDYKVGAYFWREFLSIGLFDPDLPLGKWSPSDLERFLYSPPIPWRCDTAQGLPRKSSRGSSGDWSATTRTRRTTRPTRARRTPTTVSSATVPARPAAEPG